MPELTLTGKIIIISFMGLIVLVAYVMSGLKIALMLAAGLFFVNWFAIKIWLEGHGVQTE